MANQNKLKAYVRYDGTGRVIAGGPILQRFKPAVGNWVEIDANECCNSIPTTTTTTTQGGGGVTPTAWIGYISNSNSNACNQIDGSTIILYTSTPTITIGTFLYVDAALTQVYSSPGGYSYFNIGGTVYNVFGFGHPQIGSVSDIFNCGSLTTTTTTTTTAFVGTYYVADTSAEVCGGTGLYSLPLIVDPDACTNGLITLAVGSYPDYGIVNGSTIYINLQNGNVIQVQTFGSSQMSFGCTSCG